MKAAEEPPFGRGRMKLLVGMEAAHFAWNVGDGKQVAGNPLPCSGVFVVGLAGRIYLGKEFLTMAIGTDVTVMFPVSGTYQCLSCTIRPNLSLMWSL